jgi:aminoglycoside/choline kinase family phosphotransferase
MHAEENNSGESLTTSAKAEGALSRDEEAFVRGALEIDGEGAVALLPVGKGGSDRSYFRVFVSGRPSAILMRYGDMYPENDVYVAVASFLKEAGVRAPAIYGHDFRQRLIAMEDLGDVDLYALRDRPWEERSVLYKETLGIAAKMHAFSLDRIHPPLPLMAGYDEGLYRWERNYFRENLVRNVCRIELDAPAEDRLEAELARLAERLQQGGTSLIHRDFQSQNVMIKDGEPVVIDFQGMRSGSLFYDLGSLLYDPYVRFPEGVREELLLYYRDIAAPACPWERFRALFIDASAQRLMQALGAYGFLGLQRGKPHFLLHIPAALQNLVAVSQQSGILPGLHALARRCQDALIGDSLRFS